MNNNRYYEIEIYVPDLREPAYITTYIEYSWGEEVSSFADDLLFEICQACYSDYEDENQNNDEIVDFSDYFYFSQIKINELTPAEYKEKYGDF